MVLTFSSRRGVSALRWFLASDYGAIPDEFFTDGVATSASATFTSNTANFTSADVGKTIVILRAGPSQYQDHHTTIASVQSATSVTLTNNAGRSQSSCRFYISRAGDQLTAIQAAVDAAGNAGGGIVYLAGVGYLVSGSIVLKNRVTLQGAGNHATMVHLIGGITAVPVVKNDQTSNNSAQGCVVRDLWLDGNRLRNSDYTTTLAAAYTAGASSLQLTARPPLESGSMLIGSARMHYHTITGSGPYTVQLAAWGAEGTTDASQSNGATVTFHNGHGVYFAPVPINSAPTTADTTDVPWQLVDSVYIKNVRGDGVCMFGWSENRIRNTFVHYADHFGIRPSYDTFCSDSTADTCGRAGFYIRGSSSGGSNNKAYTNGGNVAAEGFGFFFEGPSTLEEGCRQWVACNAQDNKANGFRLRLCQRATVSGTASSNGTGGAAGTYAGITMTSSTYNVIDILCTERAQDNTNSWQQQALEITDAATLGNQIRVTHAAAQAGTLLATIGPAIKAGSVLTGGNSISINSMGGTVGASPAGAGTYTPDPYLATKHLIQMPAGNITVAAPVANSTHYGAELVITIIQDATGSRTVTWNSTYKFSGATSPTLTTTASRRDTFRFRYNGTNWEEESRTLNVG